MNTIAAIALPTFLLAVLLEVLHARHTRRRRYQLRDTLANFALGVFAFLFGTGMKGIAFLTYTFVHQFALFDIGWSIGAWLLCLLFSDMVFYIFHRLGHESRIFWAAHITHHSSRFYNFSTAFRTPFHQTHRFLFWSPLALIGFHPLMILTVEALTMIYQFFLHTQAVDKLGPLEWVLNTPSHHRVHHAMNERYLDKNMGGVLIIWDRLLGTFQAEDEAPRFGVTKPVTTSNPLRLAFDEYAATFRAASRQKGLRAKIRFLLEAPGGHHH